MHLEKRWRKILRAHQSMRSSVESQPCASKRETVGVRIESRFHRVTSSSRRKAEDKAPTRR